MKKGKLSPRQALQLPGPCFLNLPGTQCLAASSEQGALSGGSLGPEAALLALCGSTTSWLARHVFGARGQMLRNCALMGMTAGLAAFFGVALGGLLLTRQALAPCMAGLHRVPLIRVCCPSAAVAMPKICSSLA